MFRQPTPQSAVERLIGALTMALGLGALIPRQGFGLYALLEASGDRVWWSMLMLTVGCWLIVGSYLHPALLRIGILSAGVAFWIALTQKFMHAALWGAAIQGCVIILFAIDTIVRLYAQARDDTTKR